ncbi:MAG: allantoicase [Actinomycetota bacterium]|nr:allantoicase [Actinomycetota bacterium]
MIDLASQQLGGRVLDANDEFFAPKENLVKVSDPVFMEGRYTDRGKWMDGWETRRRRRPGHDWCLVRLGLPGIVNQVVVDTSHFKGNYPQACSLEACSVTESATPSELLHPSNPWCELLPRADLQGDARNQFPVGSPYRFTHLRLNIFPDGGVARLRVLGEAVPDWGGKRSEDEMDLAAMASGGSVVACSDMFFSSPHHLLLPGEPREMRDGWETRRRRGPGHDWVTIRLGAGGTIERVVVDTSHFKGNAPAGCSVEVADSQAGPWRTLLPEVELRPHTRHQFSDALVAPSMARYARLNIFPDGGVSRLRLFGRLDPQLWPQLRLRWLNALPPPNAEQVLLACCGSEQWARRVVDRRPLQTVPALLRQAEQIWWDLDPADWRQAFTAHPQIGERGEDRWSSQEQAGTHGAPARTLAELSAANRAYQERFGHIFIVCASGRSADQMLAELRQRLHNEPEKELEVAAEEQRKITRLRLQKLLGAEP